MILATLIKHSSQLFEIINKSRQPSDLIASDYFRSKKYIGSHDRRFISEVTFFSLRTKSLIEYCSNAASEKVAISSEKNSGILKIAAACSIIVYDKSFSEIIQPDKLINHNAISEDKEFPELLLVALSEALDKPTVLIESWIKELLNSYNVLNTEVKEIINRDTKLTDCSSDKLTARYSMPSWILRKLTTNKYFSLTLKEACELAESFFYPAPLTIRINENYLKRDKVAEEFKTRDIPVRLCKISNLGLIIERRIQLNEFEFYKSGLIEVQDEGSQLIALAIAPKRNDKVLDACAGAGGKSLHIASIQSNKGEIIANDVEFKRLNELKKRAARSGFDSIRTLVINEKNAGLIASLEGTFDAVLIDAPCSGTGTVRRMPMQKWRINEQVLEKYVVRQQKILGFYSQFVKPGGTLIYATCSVMPDENDEVVEDFLSKNNNFVPDSLLKAFDKMKVDIKSLKEDDYKLHILTSKYGCDSFFIARMKKIN